MGLRQDPARFGEYWEQIVVQWGWEPLTEAERTTLESSTRTSDKQPSQPQSQTATSGSTLVEGKVDTNGGTFVGRDQINIYGLPQLQQLVKRYRIEEDALDEATFATQLAGYLHWVIERTQTIELRGVKMCDGSQVAYLDLEDVYVTLHARTVGGENREVKLERILSTGDKLAVVGGPGCGKTTVLIYIAWALAKAILEDRPEWAQEKLGLHLAPVVWDEEKQGPLPKNLHPTLPLPVYLPLSAYARYRFRQEDPNGKVQTLPNFLPQYLRNKHSSIDQLPIYFLNQLLAAGHDVILLLDRLDEKVPAKPRSC